MQIRRGRPGAAIALACLPCLALLADAPRLDSVVPSRGPRNEATEVTLVGEGLEAGSRAALLGGGPFVAGTYLMPDGARGVEMTGNLACVAFYDHATKLGGIQILDVSDPSSPSRVGAFETGDSGVDVQVSGGLAFVSFLNPYTYVGGLHIVDVSDPEDPTRVGTFDTFLDPQRIAVSGRYVYVAAGEEGLKIIDAGDPASPFLAGGYETPGPALDVEIAGDHAYVVDRIGLRVIDVRNPASPILAGSLDRPEGVMVGLAVSGERVYAADASGAFLTIDVADPTHPALINQVPLADAATGVVVSGRYAYVAAGYSGLQVLDLDDPLRPHVVGGRGLIGNSGYFFALAVSGGRAIVADLINGIHLLDVSSPASPALAGSLDVGGSAPGTSLVGDPLGVAVEAAVAYLADRQGGLLAIDVSEPSTPVLAGSLGTSGLAQDVAVSDGCAYVADGTRGLVVVDVGGCGGGGVLGGAEAPGNMVRVGVLETAGDALGVAISAGLAYVADGAGGLAIIDVRDPRSPRLIGTQDTPGSARDVALAGGYAYVADDFIGLQVIDVGRPEAPVLVGRYDTPGRAIGVAVAGRYAYVADLNRGLQIVDVSAAAAPTLVANLSTPGAAAGVALAGETLYLADGFSGLLEIDIADPARPVVIGRYDTPVSATGLDLAGGYAYVADGGRGLRIVRPNPPLPPPETVTPTAITLTVPAGLTPGPYDVGLVGSQGETEILPNGYTVCGAKRFQARLDPISPSRWRLGLDGDATLFDPASERRARLLLPPLPAALAVRATGRSSSDEPLEPGTTAIELRLLPDDGSGVVLLLGPDAAELKQLWEVIAGAGSIDLPRHDDHSYGDLRLAIHSGADGTRGQARRPGGITQRFRYEFASGRLVAAGAWGQAVDLLFEADAADESGCVVASAISFKTAARER